LGEIARPATYDIKPTETLVELLRAAGGFKATASRQRVLIERILPPAERTATGRDRVTIDVSSSALDGVRRPAIPLQDGDVVRVFPWPSAFAIASSSTATSSSAARRGCRRDMRLSEALRQRG
jgi:protein involved in polysaccharide export with SLBB domain